MNPESTRLLPENIESERALLHQLVGWCEGVRAAREILEPQDFSRTGHAEIFSMLCRFNDQGRCWTPSGLIESFANHADGKRIADLLSALAPFWLLRDNGPIRSHAKIVLENSVRRQGIKLLHSASEKFFDQAECPRETWTKLRDVIAPLVARLENSHAES